MLIYYVRELFQYEKTFIQTIPDLRSEMLQSKKNFYVILLVMNYEKNTATKRTQPLTSERFSVGHA